VCSRLRAKVTSGPSSGTVGFDGGGGLFQSLGVWLGQLVCCVWGELIQGCQ
jgi:hypothetical protein